MAMPTCPICNKILALPESFTGGSVCCPGCGTTFETKRPVLGTPAAPLALIVPPPPVAQVAAPVAQVVHVQPAPPAQPDSFWTRLRRVQTRAAGGGGSLALLIILIWAFWPATKKPPEEMSPEELRAEKQKLTEELKHDLLMDPPQPGQSARQVLAQVERRRPVIVRLRAVCARLGEPTDGLDEMARSLNELEDLARRQLRGE